MSTSQQQMHSQLSQLHTTMETTFSLGPAGALSPGAATALASAAAVATAAAASAPSDPAAFTGQSTEQMVARLCVFVQEAVSALAGARAECVSLKSGATQAVRSTHSLLA